jgi:hypothetical protein
MTNPNEISRVWDLVSNRKIFLAIHVSNGEYLLEPYQIKDGEEVAAIIRVFGTRTEASKYLDTVEDDVRPSYGVTEADFFELIAGIDKMRSISKDVFDLDCSVDFSTIKDGEFSKTVETLWSSYHLRH